MKKNNKVEKKETKEVTPIYKDITVSITLSKDIKVRVYDYKLDDNDNISLEDVNFNSLVSDQYILPNNAYHFVPRKFIFANECLKDWNVDDFVVVPSHENGM